jgi:O-antigen/teichoic acid export membrane protein
MNKATKAPTSPIIFNNLIKPGKSLSQRTARGGMWVFLLRIVQQIFGLARLVILARILAPHDFGLMGIALLTMSTLETFSQTGFQAALIQKKEDIESYLNAAWTVLILRGLVLFGILYFAAPYVASFFDTLEAKSIIQVIGFSVLLQAFTNIGVIYFQKELEFNKEFIYQLAGTLADFIVAISAVLILRNVWALVFGLLAGNVARCFASYLIHPYRPHLSRDLKKAKELFGFGKWILGSSILIFLLTQGDDAFVGKFLGATALGFYQLAYRISNMPATEITHVISRVTFPVYSKLQNDIPKLREAYLRVLQFTAFLSFPVAGLIFVLAPDFTKIFLGEKWMPMVPAMQVLCLFGLTRALNGTMGSIFQGIGIPKIITFGAGFQLLILIAIIYPMTIKWGITGTSLAVIIPNILVLIYLTQKLISYMHYRLGYFISFLLPPLVGSTIACIAMAFLKNWGNRGLISFLLSSLLGFGLYLIVIYMMDKAFKYGLKHNLMKLFKGAVSG